MLDVRLLLAIYYAILILKTYNMVIVMLREATRTATVYTRVDPEIKRQAELILEQLGIPMSNAVGMFLKQIVIQRGIPFEMKLSSSNPVAIGNMTKEQFNTEMQLGMKDIQAGRVISADEIEAEMRNGCKDRHLRCEVGEPTS